MPRPRITSSWGSSKRPKRSAESCCRCEGLGGRWRWLDPHEFVDPEIGTNGGFVFDEQLGRCAVRENGCWTIPASEGIWRSYNDPVHSGVS
jgi:hypothetical protein